MVDIACQRFFAQPNHPLQRQYEALRSVFIDGRSQKEVAEEFGYQYGSMRQLVCEFRKSCPASDDATDSPFFEALLLDAPSPGMTSINILRSLTDAS